MTDSTSARPGPLPRPSLFPSPAGSPMFIQEPFWNLTLSFPHARYIAVNNKYDFLPKQLEDKGMTIVADIAQVLRDARDTMDSGDNDR